MGCGEEASRNVVFCFGGRGVFQAADSTELMNHVWLNREGEGESSVHILQGDMPRVACSKDGLLLNFNATELVVHTLSNIRFNAELF